MADIENKEEKEQVNKTPVQKNSGSANKNYFAKLGIFTAFLAIIFGILVYTVILSRKSWQKNLKACVEKVLDENDSNNWTVGNTKTINNPFYVNAACFEATNRKNGSIYSAVILRVVTFYGPVSVVFTVDAEENVQMIGFSSLHGRISYNLLSNRYSKRFEYWERRIPEIIR